MADAVFELAVRGTWQGKQIANVMHIKGDSLGDGIATFAQEWVDAFYRDNAAYYDNGFTITTWHAREIALNPTLYEGTLVTTMVGTSAAIPVATQTSLVITTRTGFAGRRKRGRHYLAGLGSDRLGQDGRITAVVVTALQLAANTFLTGMPYGTGAYTWGVWSAANGETRDANGNLTSVNIATGFTPISQVVVRDIPAVQRRRRISQ